MNGIMLTGRQIERRVAPFWRGLNDYSESWTENQLVAAAKGRPIPAPDEIPTEDEPRTSTNVDTETKTSESNINHLTIPITSRSQSFNSDSSSNFSPSQTSFPAGGATSAQSTTTTGSTLFRGRAKTLAALTTSGKGPQVEMTPREMHLPKDPYVSGQPIEAYLYKDASECPICFLYYPPYLNKTRCCDQAICSECFVQIKRPDPHVPEHVDPTAPPLPLTENVESETPESGELVSEPAACPFCKQPEFGVTYDPPPFRRGLTYVNHASTHPLANAPSAMSSSSSLGSVMSNGGRLSPTSAARRRTTSVSASSPSVITTDRVRPDWHHKLTAARAHTARRSAAATALHTAAYLMGNRGQESDGRGFGPFGRRGILRRGSGADSPSGTNSSHLNMLALMSERYAASSAPRGEGEGEPSMTPGPRGSSRRNRVDDLEEMMMMEAIRLSLASEEERRKREEKDAKKEAKKKDKENKKAEKVARKTGVYPTSASQRASGPNGTTTGNFQYQDDFPSSSGKGKSPQPTNLDYSAESSSFANAASSATDDPQEHLERARAQILPTDPPNFSLPYGSIPQRPSHLRTLSNASSSTSSIEGSGPGSLKSGFREHRPTSEVSPSPSGINVPTVSSAQENYISNTPPGGGAGMEPMFNFRSLAAMVGDDEKSEDTVHEELANDGHIYGHRRGESSASTAAADQHSESTVATKEAQLQPDGSLVQPSNAGKIETIGPKNSALSRAGSGLEGKQAGVEETRVLEENP